MSRHTVPWGLLVLALVQVAALADEARDRAEQRTRAFARESGARVKPDAASQNHPVVSIAFGCKRGSADSLERLPEFQGLRELSLRVPDDLHPEAFRPLASLNNLESFVAHHTRLDGECLANLKNLQKLRRVRLTRVRLSANGVSYLGALQNVEELRLSGSTMTDQHLEQVGRLRRLTSLGLSDTSITDKGLAHLANLKRLESPVLSEKKVTAAGIRSLQQSLPQLKISTKSGRSSW